VLTAESTLAARVLLLLVPLLLFTEHEYTEANLRFEHLKGRDRHMVGALSSSRDFEVHLALVQRTVLTNIEEDSDPYGENKRCRYGYDSEDEDEENEDEEERNEDADSRAAEVRYRCDCFKRLARPGSTKDAGHS
jgi:hypothetical protein